MVREFNKHVAHFFVRPYILLHVGNQYFALYKMADSSEATAEVTNLVKKKNTKSIV